MKRNTKKIFIPLLYVLYLVVCGEVVMRIASQFVILYNIEMIKYATTLKVQSANPVLEYEHRPNSSAHLMGVDIELNSLGHRNDELLDPKPPNEKRIHFIGSSMGLGWGVPAEQTIPEVVERLLNETAGPTGGSSYVSINAGMANTNTPTYIELFKTQYEKTDADYVVVQFFLNDAEPSIESSTIVFKYSYFLAYVYQFASSAFLNISEEGTLIDYYGSLFKDDQPGWINTLQSLIELRTLCEQRSIGLCVLLMPDLHDLSPQGPFPALYSNIVEKLDEIDIAVVNGLSPVLQKFKNVNSRPWVTRDDAHPNAEVHEILAEALVEFLKISGV